MRIGIAVLVAAPVFAGCELGSEASDPLASAGALTEVEAGAEAMESLSGETADLNQGDCHFGDPLEMDEYNGIVYRTGGRPVPNGQGQVVDMWLRIPEVFELPDDISWVCNPKELEDHIDIQLLPHDEYPDDVRGFRLVEIYDNTENLLPSWYLVYHLPDDDLRRPFVRRMMLRLWNTGRINPVVDLAPVTVTACQNPEEKNACIDELQG